MSKPPPPVPPVALMTMEEAAAQLRICVRTLRNHVRDGHLAYISIGKGIVKPRRMFHAADLIAFVERQRRVEVPFDDASRRRRASTGETYEGIDLQALRAKRRAERQAATALRRRAGVKPPATK